MKAKILARALGAAAFACAAFAFMAVDADLARADRAPTAGDRGPRAVSEGEYKFPAAIDSAVLARAATELWAHAWWPKDLAASAKAPIVFLLHGNHGTCGDTSTPRHDSDCSYTSTGSCGDGGVPTPNHLGYAYLGETLASQGIVAVSINANRGITCGSGGSEDWGLNLARGRLILRHMQEWSTWSRGLGGAPEALGDPAQFAGAIDWTRVGLFGHSRGGEGARAAYNLYLDEGGAWKDKIPGASILALFEVGAVDGQTSRVLDAPGAAWTQLLPMCDGDVSDLEGRMPFERMLGMSGEARRAPKSLSMVWGANHNFFNTEWQQSDSYGCEGQGHEPLFDRFGSASESQQKIARELVSAFFRANLNGEAAMGRGFDPIWEGAAAVAQVGRVDRDFAPTIDQTLFARVDDFDRATGTSSNDVPNDANQIAIEHEENPLPKRAQIAWTRASSDAFFQANWAPRGGGRDARDFASLSFRVARPDTEQEKPATDFSIALVDAAGRLSATLPLSQFVDLVGPMNSVVTFQTVRIPLQAFAGFDLSQLAGVRFVFDRTADGKASIANVRLSPAPSNEPTNLPLSVLAAAERPAPGAERFSTPAPRSGTSQFALPLRLPTRGGAVRTAISTAVLVESRPTARSRYLSTGADAVELRFRAADRFPVRDALPYLAIGDRLFPGGRYDGGRTQELTFVVPRAEWNRLPEGGPMRVQYGAGAEPTHVWTVRAAFSRNNR